MGLTTPKRVWYPNPMTKYIYYTYQVPVTKTIRIEVSPDTTPEGLVDFFEEWEDIHSGVGFLSQATDNIEEIAEDFDEQAIRPENVELSDNNNTELWYVAGWLFNKSKPIIKSNNRFIQED